VPVVDLNSLEHFTPFDFTMLHVRAPLMCLTKYPVTEISELIVRTWTSYFTVYICRQTHVNIL